MIGAVQFAVDQVFAPEHLPLWLDRRSPAGRPEVARVRSARLHRLTPGAPERGTGGSRGVVARVPRARRTRRGREPGGTGWTATSTPRASAWTSSGCSASACAESRCSTGAWVRRWSSPSAYGTARPNGGRRSRVAASTAQRLGLEFTVATSAGWSAAGGPWVEPADAMKKIVWSESLVEGGRLVEEQLAPLPDVAGPYQDCSRWGADPAAHRYARGLDRRRSPGRADRRPAAPGACRRLRSARRLVEPGRRSLRAVAVAREGPGRAVVSVDRAGLRRTGRPSAPSPWDCPVREDSARHHRRQPCWRPVTTASPTASSPNCRRSSSRRPRPSLSAPWRSRPSRRGASG